MAASAAYVGENRSLWHGATVRFRPLPLDSSFMIGKAGRRLAARTDEYFGTMDIKVIWPDGEEERALALAATCGLGIGDLVSKVLVERCGEKVFIPCHKAKEIWIESFGERVMIREEAPVTVNMLQR